MAITTSNSMSVNPLRRRGREPELDKATIHTPSMTRPRKLGEPEFGAKQNTCENETTRQLR